MGALICRMIFDELCVLANGDIVCSCGDPAGLKVYGNVHRDRIADVYNGPDYREMRESQLSGPPSSWCPVISTECATRISRPTFRDKADGRVVRTLQLEPASYCNLRCPACPTTVMTQDIDARYGPDRLGVLPLATMLDVFDQLPDLEKLLFYNFGEPFLHPQAIPFLQEVRRRRPDVVIHTSTNGVVLNGALIDALARETLVDRVVFSIDGGTAESYGRYRVRGSLEKALANMQALVHARQKYAAQDRLEIFWQYILFEWNDSDEEIAEARRRGQEIGVPLMWIVTHTEGASRRFLPGSKELEKLMAADAFRALTCTMRAEDWRANGGIAAGMYAAILSANMVEVNATSGSRIALNIELTNAAPSGWAKQGRYRIGIQLQTPHGRQLSELQGSRYLPGEITEAGASWRETLPVAVPSAPGEYHLLIDVVHETICWFSERGSVPLIVPLTVVPPGDSHGESEQASRHAAGLMSP